MPSTVCAAATLAAVKRPPAAVAASMLRREIESMTSLLDTAALGPGDYTIESRNHHSPESVIRPDRRHVGSPSSPQRSRILVPGISDMSPVALFRERRIRASKSSREYVYAYRPAI